MPRERARGSLPRQSPRCRHSPCLPLLYNSFYNMHTDQQWDPVVIRKKKPTEGSVVTDINAVRWSSSHVLRSIEAMFMASSFDCFFARLCSGLPSVWSSHGLCSFPAAPSLTTVLLASLIITILFYFARDYRRGGRAQKSERLRRVRKKACFGVEISAAVTRISLSQHYRTRLSGHAYLVARTSEQGNELVSLGHCRVSFGGSN